MNNIKDCIRMMSIIAILFILGLYSHLNISNANEKFAVSDNTMWLVDYGMYKTLGNAKVGFNQYYECKYCPDCFCLQNQNRNSAQNPIDLITLAKNDTVNQYFDCFTALNGLENTSMILNNNMIL